MTFTTRLAKTVMLVSMLATSSFVYSDDITQLDAQLFKRQVQQANSTGRAVMQMIQHQPSATVTIVDFALNEYPTDAKEIIFAAIAANPHESEAIMHLAVKEHNIECTTAMQSALQAEPSYATYITGAAVKASPDDFTNIIQTAVASQPDNADKIVGYLAQTFPDKLEGIITSALQSANTLVEYMLEALFAVYPEQKNKVLKIALRETRHETAQLEQVVRASINSGVSNEDLLRLSKQADASVQVTAILAK